jgi:hypothetical protein
MEVHWQNPGVVRQACLDSHGPQLISLMLLLYKSINLCKRTDLIGREYLSMVFYKASCDIFARNGYFL